jgi:hypothetical protein
MCFRLCQIPEGFNLHRRLANIIKMKAAMFDAKAGFDWGTAEALAFGSLLRENVHVRLSGQVRIQNALMLKALLLRLVYISLLNDLLMMTVKNHDRSYVLIDCCHLNRPPSRLLSAFFNPVSIKAIR